MITECYMELVGLEELLCMKGRGGRGGREKGEGERTLLALRGRWRLEIMEGEERFLGMYIRMNKIRMNIKMNINMNEDD